jgi:NADPH2:quinone reductase
LYPLKSFPATLGMEAAGTIVGLPSDDGVLGNKDYKERKFQVGGKVVVVRVSTFMPGVASSI